MKIFINQKKFNKVLLIGLDLDLVDELEENKIKIIGYTSNIKRDCKYNFFGCIKKNSGVFKPDIGFLLCDSDISLKNFVFNKFKENLLTYVSKKAIVTNYKNIGLGSIIQANTFLSNNVVLGKCVKLNVGCQIHHDVKIGDFSILGPGCIILGNSIIGKNSFIGASSVIRNKLNISANSYIGMGSVVVSNTKKNKIYCGNPAKIKKELL